MTVPNGGAEWTSFLMAFGLLAQVFAIGAWDIYAIHFLDYRYTVSFIVNSWISKAPALFAGFFITLGHVIWPLFIKNNGGGP